MGSGEGERGEKAPKKEPYRKLQYVWCGVCGVGYAVKSE
jgi:hypothetical protein